ncbi:hypothetical protein [Rhizobium giardinii]
MTPAKAVERARVEVARSMVEDSRRTFDEIACPGKPSTGAG